LNVLSFLPVSSVATFNNEETPGHRVAKPWADGTGGRSPAGSSSLTGGSVTCSRSSDSRVWTPPTGGVGDPLRGHPEHSLGWQPDLGRFAGASGASRRGGCAGCKGVR
jgi:hypothetical protein